MTYEAKRKPLTELSLTESLGYLTSLYDDCACTCACKPETYDQIGEWPKNIANKNAEICKDENIYDTCPQRIAFERVKEALEKAKNMTILILSLEKYWLMFPKNIFRQTMELEK